VPSTRYRSKSRSPSALRTSSSIRKWPLYAAAGLLKTTYAASATISAVRQRRIMLLSPNSNCTADVAIAVRGQRALTAIRPGRNSSAIARTQRLIPYLAMV
jgi:hypothetical protein